MYPVKKPEADLRLHYKRNIEIAVIISLAFHILLFLLIPEISSGYNYAQTAAIEIKVEDIPQTEQLRNQAPPPPRPAVPIPSEDEMIPEDATIESTDLSLDLTELPPPPAREEDDAAYMFIPYDEPPSPVGGYAEILSHLSYPEIARKSGMEGIVIVGVLIDAKGRALKTQVLKDSGSNIGFEQAAEAAVLATRWNPAKQRDQAIKVWVSIPVRFQLTEGDGV